MICLNVFYHFFSINVSVCHPHDFCVLQPHLCEKTGHNIVRLWKSGWLGCHWITGELYLSDRQFEYADGLI